MLENESETPYIYFDWYEGEVLQKEKYGQLNVLACTCF